MALGSRREQIIALIEPDIRASINADVLGVVPPQQPIQSEDMLRSSRMVMEGIRGPALAGSNQPAREWPVTNYRIPPPSPLKITRSSSLDSIFSEIARLREESRTQPPPIRSAALTQPLPLPSQSTVRTPGTVTQGRRGSIAPTQSGLPSQPAVRVQPSVLPQRGRSTSSIGRVGVAPQRAPSVPQIALWTRVPKGPKSPPKPEAQPDKRLVKQVAFALIYDPMTEKDETLPYGRMSDIERTGGYLAETVGVQEKKARKGIAFGSDVGFTPTPTPSIQEDSFEIPLLQEKIRPFSGRGYRAPTDLQAQIIQNEVDASYIRMTNISEGRSLTVVAPEKEEKATGRIGPSLLDTVASRQKAEETIAKRAEDFTALITNIKDPEADFASALRIANEAIKEAQTTLNTEQARVDNVVYHFGLDPEQIVMDVAGATGDDLALRYITLIGFYNILSKSGLWKNRLQALKDKMFIMPILSESETEDLNDDMRATKAREIYGLIGRASGTSTEGKRDEAKAEFKKIFDKVEF